MQVSAGVLIVVAVAVVPGAVFVIEVLARQAQVEAADLVVVDAAGEGIEVGLPNPGFAGVGQHFGAAEVVVVGIVEGSAAYHGHQFPAKTQVVGAQWAGDVTH